MVGKPKGMRIPTLLIPELLLGLGGCASALKADSTEPVAAGAVHSADVPILSERCVNRMPPTSKKRSEFDVLALSRWMDIFWTVHAHAGTTSARVDRCFNLGAGDACWSLKADVRWDEKQGYFVAESAKGWGPITNVKIAGSVSQESGGAEGTVDERDQRGEVRLNALLYLSTAQDFFSRLELLQSCNVQALAKVAK